MSFTNIIDNGARRIQAVLAQKNIPVNTKRIPRLMSEHGLIPKGTKKRCTKNRVISYVKYLKRIRRIRCGLEV